jgi:hypothetical protein
MTVGVLLDQTQAVNKEVDVVMSTNTTHVDQ